MQPPVVTIHSAPQFYRCEPGWSWSPPPLPDHDLWYVLDGVGQVTWDGREYPVGAQTCFVFPPGVQIQARQDPQRRLRVFAVHFGCRGQGLLTRPAVVRDAVFFVALARRCEVSYRQGTTAARRQSAELVGQMLLHLCVEAESTATGALDSRIRAVVERIQEEAGQRWPVAELAREAGLSRSQFTRRFTALTGLGPERFVIEARIDRAKQLLRETDMTVSQIADALGYRDVYFFSRQFTRVAGQTAMSYRK